LLLYISLSIKMFEVLSENQILIKWILGQDIVAVTSLSTLSNKLKGAFDEIHG